MKKLFILIISLLPCTQLLAQTGPYNFYLFAEDKSGTTQTYTACKEIKLEPNFSYTATAGTTFTANINPNQTCDASFVTDNDYAAGSPLLSGEVGDMAGTFSVLPSGAASYFAPLSLPPGVNGMVPQLGFSYNSNAGNGMMGMGWNLTGLSEITRSTINRYFDNETAANYPQINNNGKIRLTSDKRFLLDGERMVLLQGQGADDKYTQGPATYALENEDYSRIYGIKSTANEDIQYFRVETKDGMIMEYGYNPGNLAGNSSDLGLDCNNASRLKWPLTMMEDKFGNRVLFTYSYTVSTGECYITKIEYAKNANSKSYVTVNFIYEKNRSDAFKMYVGGCEMQNNQLLDRVEILADTKPFRTYGIEYISDINSLVKTITEYGSDGTHYRPAVFNWNKEKMASDVNAGEVLSSDKTWNYTVADFNGDGKDDILQTSGVMDNKYILNFSVNPNVGQALTFDNRIQSTLNPGTTSVLSLAAKSRDDSKHIIDYNGDGVADLMAINETDHTLTPYISSPTGIGNYYSLLAKPGYYAPPANGGDGKVAHFISDFNADGLVDMINVSGTYQFPQYGIYGYSYNSILSDGSDPLYRSNNTFYPPGKFDYLSISPANVDDNGFTDLCGIADTNGQLKLSPIYIAQDKAIQISKCKGIISKTINATYPGDFNGDNKTDILIVYQNLSTSIAYADGTANVVKPDTTNLRLPAGFLQSYSYIVTGDFNGDGNDDVLTAKSTNPHPDQEQFIQYEFNIYYSSGHNRFTKSNTFYEYNACNKTKVTREYTNYQPGVTTGQYTVTYNTTTKYGLDNAIQTGDFNGDGITDLMFVNKDVTFKIDTGSYFVFNSDKSNFQPYTPSSTPVYKNGTDKVRIMLINKYIANYKITDGTTPLGQKATFTYNNLVSSAAYTKGKNAVYPAQDVQNADVDIVEKLVIDDAVAGISEINYSYKGLINSLYRRNQLGFTQITVDNITTKDKVEKYFDYESTSQRLLLKTEKYYKNSENIKDVNYATYASNLVYDAAGNLTRSLFIYPNHITTTDYLNKINTDATQTIDVNGNTSDSQLTTTSTGTHASQTQVAVNNTYTTAGSRLSTAIPNKLLHTSAISTRNGQSFTTNKDFDYNTTTGSLKQAVTTYQGYIGSTIVNYDEFDIFGNPHKVSTTGVSGSNKTKTGTVKYEMAGDGSGRFVTKTTNDLGFATQNEYNEDGTVKRSLDYAGNATQYFYDAFSRIKKVLYPDGKQETVTYNWADAAAIPLPGATYYTLTESNVAPATTTWYNQRGQVIKTESTDIKGQKIFNKSVYDVQGKLTSSSIAQREQAAEKKTEYAYDVYDRVISTKSPLNTIAYDNTEAMAVKATNTSSDKMPYSKQVYNVDGNVMQSTDNGGDVVYTYDARGLPVKIEPTASGSTNIAYYADGKKLSIDEPNTGKIVYEYDGFGQLSTQNDLKQNLFTMTYDAIGRILTKTGKNETITYDYDKDTDYPYALTSVSRAKGTAAPDNVMTYDYDRLGRIVATHQTIGAKVLDMAYTYDAKGRPATVQYPDNLVLKNQYDETNGFLTGLSNDNIHTPVWAIQDVNTNGQLTQIKYGTNLQVDMSYNDIDNTLTHIRAKKTDANVNVFHYGFETTAATGNLRTRTKYTGETIKLSETFEYDFLERLKTKTGNGPALNMDYDVNGNITLKSDVGTKYTYDSNNKPHAVKTIENPTADVIPRIPQDITYTDFDKVETVSENNTLLTMGYGVNMERTTAELKNIVTGKTAYTRLYAGNYEETTIPATAGQTAPTVRKITYISGPAGLCAMHVQNTATNTDSTYFVLTDNLGSITMITDEQGNPKDERSYDAWGRLRDPNTWTPLPGGAGGGLKVTDRGYTTHEHLQPFNLINMNGRCYDPLIGRMLSPDALVQSPNSTQSYNRYSYCSNNPLSYTDPTGYRQTGRGYFDVAAANSAVVKKYYYEQYGNYNNIDFYNFGRGSFASGGGGGAGAGGGVSAAFSSAVDFTAQLAQNIQEGITKLLVFDHGTQTRQEYAGVDGGVVIGDRAISNDYYYRTVTLAQGDGGRDYQQQNIHFNYGQVAGTLTGDASVDINASYSVKGIASVQGRKLTIGASGFTAIKNAGDVKFYGIAKLLVDNKVVATQSFNNPESYIYETGRSPIGLASFDLPNYSGVVQLQLQFGYLYTNDGMTYAPLPNYFTRHINIH